MRCDSERCAYGLLLIKHQISKMVDEDQMKNNRVVHKIDQQDEQGLNALFFCVNSGNQPLCELLINHGIGIDMYFFFNIDEFDSKIPRING